MEKSETRHVLGYIRELESLLREAQRVAAQARAAAKSDSEATPLAIPALPPGHHDRMRAILEIVRELSTRDRASYAFTEDVVAEASRQGMPDEHARKTLAALMRSNQLYAKGGPNTHAVMT